MTSHQCGTPANQSRPSGDHLPRCDCGHLFEICDYPNCPIGSPKREADSVINLVLEMGRVIRSLDETGEHSELWTQDGDYVIDGRFPR